MKSEKNQNVSTKKVNILDKITKRSDYIRASTGSNKRTSSLHLQKFKREDAVSYTHLTLPTKA